MLQISRGRALAHGLVLAVITTLAVTGIPRAQQVTAQQQPEQAASVDTLQQAQLMLPLQGPPAPRAASAPGRTQGADQTTLTTVMNPRLGLPHWVRALRDTTLWSSQDAEATPITTVSAGTTYLKPLGEFTDGRLEVYFPDSQTPAEAWVDLAAVEPSGIPGWIATPGAESKTGSLPAAPTKTGDASPPNVSAWYVAIVDDASGQLIYGEQPHVSVPQASTTKIATTIVALERAPDLAQRVKISISATAMAARDGSSTLGIEPGRSLRLDTLLYGMMLPSGNDAAEQVALSVAGSREQFIGWMNDEAAALGLADTHFANPSGMDAAGHYSSAYDMAMLARYAMRNPTFRTLASTANYTSDGFPMHNLNRLLDNYPGADGVKIGYTDLAQKTIVASAVHDGHRVYVSLMHSADLVTDSTRMFDWVWDNFSWPATPPSGE